MPEYAYKCEACGKNFKIMMGIMEHTTAKVVCPKCSSKKIEQQITTFSVSTRKKS